MPLVGRHLGGRRVGPNRTAGVSVLGDRGHGDGERCRRGCDTGGLPQREQPSCLDRRARGARKFLLVEFVAGAPGVRLDGVVRCSPLRRVVVVVVMVCSSFGTGFPVWIERTERVGHHHRATPSCVDVGGASVSGASPTGAAARSQPPVRRGFSLRAWRRCWKRAARSSCARGTPPTRSRDWSNPH